MEKLVAYLQKHFLNLSPDELQLLAQAMVVRELPQYQTLYRKAEPSNAFFVIDTGRVSLIDEDARPIFTATSANCLGDGEFFRQEPHLLTARADSDAVYWEMSEAAFLEVLAANPRIGLRIGQQESTIAQMSDYLLGKLGAVPALSSLGHDILLGLARSFKPMELQVGDVLYRQGDASQGLYLVDAGNMVRTGATIGRQPLPANDLLGVDTLFQDNRHDHTAEAAGESLCWVLSRGDFTRLNTMHPVLQRALQSVPLPPAATPPPPAPSDVLNLAELLRRLPALRSVPSLVLEAAATQFTSLTVKAGEVVYSAEDESDAFYLVMEGEIELSMSSDTGVNQELSRVTPGAECAFGLESLLSRTPRAQQATATVDTELRRMSGEHLAALCAQYPELQAALQDGGESRNGEVSSTDLGDLSMFAVFSGLSGADLARFPAVLRPATFYPQEQIYARGDLLEHLYLLQEGSILLEREGDAEPQYLSPGSTLGVFCLMSGEPSLEHAFASSEVRVISLSRDKVVQLAAEIPQFQENLWKIATLAQPPTADPAAVPSAPPAAPPPNPYEEVPVPSEPPAPVPNPYTAPPVPPEVAAPAPAPPDTLSPPPPAAGSPPGSIPPPVMEDDPFLLPDKTPSPAGGFGKLSAGGKLRAVLLAILLLWLALALVLPLIGVDVAFLPLALGG